MTKPLTLSALASLALGVTIVATPASANAMPEPVCTTTYHQYDVPNPTRRGIFIGHFDENGVPQSVVTPSDSDTTCFEQPYENDIDQ